jgi:uncharacterized protein (TIGR03067 family)
MPGSSGRNVAAPGETVMNLRGVLFLAAALLLAADDPKPGADREKIQGAWKVRTLVDNGKEQPRAEHEKLRIHFTARHVTFTLGDEKREGTYKLDPSRKPPRIEIELTDGPSKGRKDSGVYQLEGDTLTLCLTLKPGEEPPADFTSKAGSGRTLFTLERVKP